MSEETKAEERKLRTVTIVMKDNPKDPRMVDVSFETDMTAEEKAGKVIPQSPTYVKLFHIMQLFAPKGPIKGKAVKRGEKPTPNRKGTIHVPPASNSRKPAKILGPDGRPL